MERISNVAIFASGRGSNARAILDYSKLPSSHYTVGAILSNRENAGVLEIAAIEGIPFMTCNKVEFSNGTSIKEFLMEHQIDMIVLAGFLWLIPGYLIESFPNRILNIHPALLPNYGGKGMYGHHIHKAVKEYGDLVSGITIHFVNEAYDEGQIVFQTQCKLSEEDTHVEIAQRVLRLEHYFYPKVINGIASRL